ncbi:MAG: pantetheine-phosphate adenylyltransferase [Conexivisphaerales archaeon]
MHKKRAASKRFKVVALGGTFDHLHRGHRALLDEGFEIGGTLLIGVVSDALAHSLGKTPEQHYNARFMGVARYISEKHPNEPFKLFQLQEPYGPLASDPAVEAVVVTPDSFDRGMGANLVRAKAGLRAVHVVLVPLVVAEDGVRISSTRIRRREIDREGRLLPRRR